MPLNVRTLKRRYSWDDAIAFAREGVSKPLADLINDHAPAAHHAAIAAIVTRGVPPVAGRKRRLSPTLADLARALYAAATAPKAEGGDGCSPSKARREVAKTFGVDPTTIGEVVEMTGAYAADKRRGRVKGARVIVGKHPL